MPESTLMRKFELKMKAKKSLGQHFLRSEKALASIINAANLSSGDVVLEIGPGHGALTERLLAYSLQVTAIEKDDELFELLKQKFEKEIKAGKLILVHDDILNYKLPTTNPARPAGGYKLVANIPYNITGAIFKKFLSAEYQPETMVLLIQKEVAERIVARDGKESILSISVKAYGKPRYIEQVKAGSFVPAPKVDSAILAVEDISKDFFQKMANNMNLEAKLPSVGRSEKIKKVKEVEKRFFEMMKVGFGSKRKRLSSNLSLIFPKERVLEAFSNLNLDENLRAEDVNIQTWQKLALALI